MNNDEADVWYCFSFVILVAWVNPFGGHAAHGRCSDFRLHFSITSKSNRISKLVWCHPLPTQGRTLRILELRTVVWHGLVWYGVV